MRLSHSKILSLFVLKSLLISLPSELCSGAKLPNHDNFTALELPQKLICNL